VALDGTDETPPDKLEGTQIAGYEIGGLLGRGSMARVYRATRIEDRRELAFKILYGKSAGEERAKKRMQREAKLLARVDDPHVVRMQEFGITESGAPFLVMELLEGRSLKDLLAEGRPLPIEQAAHIARQIALGLAAAHDNGLVHRDLKPANVMVVDDGALGQVKILDFGIARIIDLGSEDTRLTRSNMLLGTPRYISPEQIRGASTVGPETDLYALGLVLYAMLDGDAPFDGSAAEVVHAHLYTRPAPLPPSRGLASLAYALLEKDPRDRPRSARRVVRAIDRLGILEGKKRSRTAPLIAASFAVAIAVLGWALYVRAKQEPERPVTEPEVPPPLVEASPPPPAFDDLLAVMSSALNRRGLSRSDLSGSAAEEGFERFEHARDRKSAEKALDLLLRRIASWPIDEALLERKVDRVKAALEQVRPLIPEDEYEMLENRFLSASSEIAPGLGNARTQSLAIKLAGLEHDIAQARGAGSERSERGSGQLPRP
jgi:serine/threonine-protein kinase